MEIPAILKGDVHLPLKEGMTSHEAIALTNSFYGTDLKIVDFRLTQVFTTDSGHFNLELIEEATGLVKVLFINKNQDVITNNQNGFDNPLLVTDSVHWLAAPVVVYNAQEITFLDAMNIDDVYPITGTDNELAYRLSSLLNQYRVLGRWVSGTLGDYCTGGFKLVFKGRSEDAPSEFQVGGSPYLVVVQILHGTNQGYLCLRV